MLSKLEFSEKELFPKNLIGFKQKDSLISLFSENGVILQINIISSYIIRIRYSTKSYFQKDFSYAIDPSFKSTNQNYRLENQNDFIKISTDEIFCTIKKDNFNISFFDSTSQLINTDGKGFHWEENEEYGGEIVKMGKLTQPNEAFYGLGDKPTDLNLYGKTFQNWGSDTYGYEENTDPSYRNIPLYYGLHNGIGYGIFFDNSFKTHFDFGKGNPLSTFFWAPGGEMNYYFIAGPKLLDVCRRYTKLTGTPELPPLWALGYQQCKWSYFPEEKVEDIANKMRENKIPCDAIYLDIDYMDGFRCFTWDNEKFPNPKEMIASLKSKGFKTVVIIDPGIKIDENYDVFNDGLKHDVFCKRQEGDFIKGKVWPEDCYFPDFTDPNVRVWWGNLFKELINEVKVDGVWNDMNEPALFEVESKTFPLDVRHNYDGNPCSHRKGHNVYGMQMARATYEGIKKVNSTKRPLVITRSGYAGLQRFASVWTGDNLATWRHLYLANVQCQRLSISGVSFCGSDIGGFVYHPTPELFYRWVQLGVFHPFFRTHSSGDHGDQEPWSFGQKALDIVRKAIELRYRLLPYIYTAFFQYHKEGTPIIRPLIFTEQLNKNIHKNNEFMVGDHLLICPVIHENIKGQNIYLPQGNWYHYHTNQLYEGGKEYWIDIIEDNIPVFVKAGAVIPHFPMMQYVGEFDIETVDLHIYYDEGINNESAFYQDEGEGYAYLNNGFKFSNFIFNGKDFTLTQNIIGNYQPSYDYRIQFIGFPKDINIEIQEVDADFKMIDLK